MVKMQWERRRALERPRDDSEAVLRRAAGAGIRVAPMTKADLRRLADQAVRLGRGRVLRQP